MSLSAGDNPLFRGAAFLAAAAALRQAPADEGFEVAFAGRSNVGKSSVLNVLCGQRGLARTSKTPGRTQTINFFRLDDERRLVDLPGYGYARVPGEVRQRWQGVLADYLRSRRCLKGVVLLMDIRHPLTGLDTQMLEWNAHHALPTHVLLTKADKLSRGAAQGALYRVRAALSGYGPLESAQLFSAHSGLGIAELQGVLESWLALSAADEG
jgi:GTP-binding protein